MTATIIDAMRASVAGAKAYGERRPRCPSLKAMAAFIMEQWPHLRAVVDEWECNTDRNAGRLRIPGKGRTGNRLRVYRQGEAQPILDHNSAETYRQNWEVADIILAKLDGRTIQWDRFVNEGKDDDR